MSASTRLRAATQSVVDALLPPTPVYAHCDIPCGIYDPHEAQISALTVVRMDQLIAELPMPGPNLEARGVDRLPGEARPVHRGKGVALRAREGRAPGPLG